MQLKRLHARISGRAAIAAAVAAALPTSALGAVARVDFAIGKVTSVDKNGKQRRLTKGSRVDNGDTVITERGRAQLRFSDGGYTSLAPNTEFRIDDYQFTGEENEGSRSFFSLLKGGLRTITGAIGKLRKKAYKLSTPVATIGIRGTEYVATFYEGDGLSVTVGGGQIEVCSNTQCATFDAGETGIVTDADSDPQSGDEQTTIAPPAPQTDYAQGDDRNPDGTNQVLARGLESGPFYALSSVFAEFFSSEGGYGSAFIETRGRVDDGDLVSGLFDSTGALVAFDYDGPADGGPYAGGAFGVEDAGQVDGLVGWGRWTGAAVVSGPYTGPVNELHYAIGIPTPEPEIPTSGTATMSLAGGTPPALVTSGGITLGTISPDSKLVANFGTNTVTADIRTSVAGSTYRSMGPLTIGKDASGSARPRSVFGASSSSSTLTTTGSSCSSGCDTYMEGFFAGSGASHAGLTYKFQAADGSFDYVLGSGGFRR